MVLDFPADVLLLKTNAAASDYANDAEHYFVNDITFSPSYYYSHGYISSAADPPSGYSNQIAMYACYNDDMFDTDANYESTDLAKLGVCLASWAYNGSGIKDAYEAMGYSCVTENYDFTPTYDNNDTAAFALGYKQVDNTNYFLCTVRGTSSNCEWFSNFNVGTGTAHVGFNKAASETLHSTSRSTSPLINLGTKVFQDGRLLFVFKATPHNYRLTALHVINLHKFRHIAQILLDLRQQACVKFRQSDEISDCVSNAQ